MNYSQAECEKLFAVLFPRGFAGKDVLEEIAPEGWSQSSLRFVFHPSTQQLYEEALRLHRNLESLAVLKSKRSRRAPPTIEETATRRKDIPIDVEREAGELVGMCIWDIFSDEHDVLDLGGRIVDIGSFRGAAGFIADQLNRQTATVQYDYMDFYMGSIWISQRADLTPVYQSIFRRLKGCDLSWRYHFPKLHLVQFHEPTADDSSKTAKRRAELKENHRKAIEDAKLCEPPATVRAFCETYGHIPEGWPPWECEEPE